MIFHGPLQLCAVNVLAIEGADALLRGRDGVPETGNRYCRQQTDDGHDDHDFDEGESGYVFCVHGIPDLLNVGRPLSPFRWHRRLLRRKLGRANQTDNLKTAL